nr:hypothetical protein CFP56_25559 [Quercus suber]
MSTSSLSLRDNMVMESDIIPFCGIMGRRRSRRRYHRLKSEENIQLSISEVPKYAKTRVAPKATFSIKFLKRFRDDYVEMMLCLAGHIAQLNNGNVYLYKKIPNAPLFSPSQEFLM